MKKTIQVLHVGEHIVEVTDKGDNTTHRAAIQINPAKASFFSVGKISSQSSSKGKAQYEDHYLSQKTCVNYVLTRGLTAEKFMSKMF